MAYYAGQKLRASDLGQSTTCAEFNQTSAQTIATATETKLAFGTTNASSTLVTQAVDGVGHSFTLEREGIWTITTSIMWAAIATGERLVYIWLNGSGIAVGGSPNPAAAFTACNVSVTRPFAENDVIHIVGFHGRGSNLDTFVDNSRGIGRLNLCWLGG